MALTGAREFCLDGKTLGPAVIVTPGKATTISDTGTVRGFVVDPEDGQPVSGQRVVLASYELVGEHVKYTVRWDAQGDVVNSAETDTTGAFSIDAPVGSYVLITQGSGLEGMAYSSETGKVLFIEALANRTVDVGKVQLWVLVGP